MTALLTNTLLVILKLVHRMRTTGQSLRETSGISTVHERPLVYNVIDADHVDDKDDAGDSDGEGDGRQMAQEGATLGFLGGIACCACGAGDNDEA